MFEPFQGHSGAELIAPELLNQVAIALRWKEYLYHVGSSSTANSTYKQGSSQVDRTLKKGDKRSASHLWTLQVTNQKNNTMI